ncbi:nonsense-mediated mRNA decay factor SMG9-like [Oppia nitens]|uniref:nonsense-mediated mRNA decay factor SMG9-like n=1 Tax=Oppia nitens TaxID=1686743 RepID=UPI0023DA4448|nr:nonsense-mediated mRNA decay factor SMG9-like [Oppia nitens]
MDHKLTIEPSRRPHRRRHRDVDRNHTNDDIRRSANTSQSPPQQSRVVILAKNPNNKSAITPSITSQLNSTSQSSVTTTPIQSIQIFPSLHSSQQQQTVTIASTSANTSTNNTPVNQSSLKSVTVFNSHSSTDDTINKSLLTISPQVIPLIDSENLMFVDSLAADWLYSDTQSASGFSVISAVGLDGVGKSSTLNLIAGKDVFRVHNFKYSEKPLRHRTKGVKLHITKERLLLLDSQPLLSASVLDEYLQKCPPLSSTGVDISEPENYSYMISLQLLSFLFATCDYIIIVMNWFLDIHLIKLMATAIMMVGDNAQKSDIIIYFTDNQSDITKDTIQMIKSLLGRSVYVTIINGDENQLLNTVMKAPTKPNSSHSSEKAWLLSSQRYWETSVRKSSLFSDYGRFLP